MVYLVKRFVENALPKFSRSFVNHFNSLKNEQKKDFKLEETQKEACFRAFKEYVNHENAFIELVNYLVEIGA